jgi:hypothetical protein
MRKIVTVIVGTLVLILGNVFPANAFLLDPQIALGSSTSAYANILFAKQNSDGHDVLTYIISTSKDNRATWTERTITVDGSQPTVSVQLVMPPATATYVRIASLDDNMRSNWSNEIIATTKGIRAMRVYVKTYSGAPISGGAVSWTANNGKTKSSTQFGLTNEGYIDFPALPAGNATVKLVGGELPDGTRVSGTFNAFLGFNPVVLSTPNPPLSVRTLTVQLPNGVPVANASVNVDSSYLSSAITLNGFTFRIPDSSGLSISPDYDDDDWVDEWDEYQGTVESSGVTDNLGRFTVVGLTNTVPGVKVEYDDGIISQTATGQLSNYNTVISLDYEPYVDVLQAAVLVDSGETAVIPIQIDLGEPIETSSFRVSANHYKPLNFGPMAVTPTTISLIRPDGASVGRCGATGKTSLRAGSQGSIRICATKSGVYRIKSGAGVVSTGFVTLHVKNAAPMSPKRVKVTSGSPGKASLSWAAPEYTGGSPVTYTITVKQGSRVVKTLTSTSRSVVISNLLHATSYTFSVKATNKFGNSDSVHVQTTVV